MKPNSRAILLVSAAVILASGCRQTEPVAKPSAMATNTFTTQATVIAVNRPEREVVLRARNGTTMGYVLDERVKNFDQIEVGDVVTVQYQEAMAIAVQPATGEPAAGTTDTLKTAPLGEKPGATGTRVSQLTARVEDVDYRDRMVTLRGPEGGIRKIKVGPEIENLDAVKKGDEVLVRYTEAVAVAVTK